MNYTKVLFFFHPRYLHPDTTTWLSHWQEEHLNQTFRELLDYFTQRIQCPESFFNSPSRNIGFYSNYGHNKIWNQITIKFFYICHDSTAVMICAKFCCDSVTIIWVIIKQYLGDSKLRLTEFVVRPSSTVPTPPHPTQSVPLQGDVSYTWSPSFASYMKIN